MIEVKVYSLTLPTLLLPESKAREIMSDPYLSGLLVTESDKMRFKFLNPSMWFPYNHHVDEFINCYVKGTWSRGVVDYVNSVMMHIVTSAPTFPIIVTRDGYVIDGAEPLMVVNYIVMQRLLETSDSMIKFVNVKFPLVVLDMCAESEPLRFIYTALSHHAVKNFLNSNFKINLRHIEYLVKSAFEKIVTEAEVRGIFLGTDLLLAFEYGFKEYVNTVLKKLSEIGLNKMYMMLSSVSSSYISKLKTILKNSLTREIIEKICSREVSRGGGREVEVGSNLVKTVISTFMNHPESSRSVRDIIMVKLRPKLHSSDCKLLLRNPRVPALFIYLLDQYLMSNDEEVALKFALNDYSRYSTHVSSVVGKVAIKRYEVSTAVLSMLKLTTLLLLEYHINTTPLYVLMKINEYLRDDPTNLAFALNVIDTVCARVSSIVKEFTGDSVKQIPILVPKSSPLYELYLKYYGDPLIISMIVNEAVSKVFGRGKIKLEEALERSGESEESVGEVVEEVGIPSYLHNNPWVNIIAGRKNG